MQTNNASTLAVPVIGYDGAEEVKTMTTPSLRMKGTVEPAALRLAQFFRERDVEPQLDPRPLPEGLPPRGPDGMWGYIEIAAAIGRTPRAIAKLQERRRTKIGDAWQRLPVEEQDALLASPQAERLAWKDATVGPRDIPEPATYHVYNRKPEARYDPWTIIRWAQQTGRLSLDFQPLALYAGGRAEGFTNPGAARMLRGWPRDERGRRLPMSPAEKAAWRAMPRQEQDEWLAQPTEVKLAWIARVKAEAARYAA